MLKGATSLSGAKREIEIERVKQRWKLRNRVRDRVRKKKRIPKYHQPQIYLRFSLSDKMVNSTCPFNSNKYHMYRSDKFESIVH